MSDALSYFNIALDLDPKGEAAIMKAVLESNIGEEEMLRDEVQKMSPSVMQTIVTFFHSCEPSRRKGMKLKLDRRRVKRSLGNRFQ